jgi:hypothetical protein
MKPREEFMNQDFVQYAAECRRMARLARKPPGKTAIVRPSLGQQFAGLLEHLVPRLPQRQARAALSVPRRYL